MRDNRDLLEEIKAAVIAKRQPQPKAGETAKPPASSAKSTGRGAEKAATAAVGTKKRHG
jgi:hypothetical protein